MNFSTNWRDRRSVFTPKHYSIANFSTETKNEMRTAFGEDLFLNNLHLIPDPLMKNLADTIITEEKMAPKSKLENHSDVKTNENMDTEPDYSPLSGIANFFSGVLNVISNAMFSKPKESDFGAETDGQMAVPSLWQGAKCSDENKILLDENCSNDFGSEILASEMTDCRQAVAHCQNKIEQVRLLLSSKPVPCTFRPRRRPKKVFVEASSVEDCFEDAFSPEDFENIANDSYIQYSSPACYHDHVFHEINGPRVKIETAESPQTVPELPRVSETTEIVKNVPEIDTSNENKLEDVTKTELVASCEDKISKLKALLQERRKKPKMVIEPEPVSMPEPKELPTPKTTNKVKDKRFKNPNRCCSKRMKLKMKKNIQDDVLFANEINSEDLSSVENSPSTGNLEKFMTSPTTTEKEYFDEVSGRFHSTSATESEDSFQIVFNDTPRLRRVSDCDSEDSFIVFEDSPDSCYTSNDVFGESEDSEEYDSDSDLSDSGCGNMTSTLASLSKSVCNLADDSLYGEDEVDCAKSGVTVCKSASLGDLQTGDLNTGLLINERKKLLRKDLPAKRVHFSTLPPKVHVMRVWSFAARQARAGHWERYTLDRDRFKRRIADVDVAVSWVLKPQHRSRVMFQRFMPWWNAQKRKELAEKKEEEAQEKLRRDEELRAEEVEKLKAEEALNCKENIAEVGDTTTPLSKGANGLLNSFEEGAKTDNAGDKTRNLEKDITEDGPKQELTDVKLNGELRPKDIIKNDINHKGKKIGSPNKKIHRKFKDNILKNNTEATENEIKIDKKNCMSNNSQIIPLNDKILELQADFVAKKILDT